MERCGNPMGPYHPAIGSIANRYFRVSAGTGSLLVVRSPEDRPMGALTNIQTPVPAARFGLAVAGPRHEKWAPRRFGGPSRAARRPDHAFSRHPARGRG